VAGRGRGRGFRIQLTGAGVNKLCPRVMCPLPSIPGAGCAGGIRGMRAEGRREGKRSGFRRGVIELSGNVLKTRMI
jgi:hypothetical protein